MSYRSSLYAALAVSLMLPSLTWAQDAPIRPVLSTTMQRVCQARLISTTSMSGGTEIPNPQSQVQPYARSLVVSPGTGGYRIVHTNQDANGDQRLSFTITNAGQVKDADLTGSAFTPVRTRGIDMPALAASLADDIPERLLVGRTFAIGESYYPEDLRQNLLRRIVASQGLPFPLTSDLNIYYRGEIQSHGGRAWLFEGEMSIGGGGEIQGQQLGVDQVTKARVVHDAETGLVLEYTTTAEIRITLEGRPAHAAQVIDAFTCEITPS